MEQDRAGIVNATQELVKIKSVREDPPPGPPFGEGPAKALVRALQMAEDLSFATKNLDGYIGYAEYGQGDDYVAVLAHLDVVPEGGLEVSHPTGPRFTTAGSMAGGR